MDTSNFQDLGESSTHDFKAGEFAKPSLVSSAVTLGAASIGSLVRITKLYTNGVEVGQIGILISCLPNESGCDIAFSFGSDFYDRTDFELVRPSSIPSQDLQLQLISHLNALLAVSYDSVNIPALLFVVDKLHQVTAFDDDCFKRELESNIFHACQLLRFGSEDLTNASTFGRRVAGVFIDAAFEKLKRAVVILKADALGVLS